MSIIIIIGLCILLFKCTEMYLITICTDLFIFYQLSLQYSDKYILVFFMTCVSIPMVFLPDMTIPPGARMTLRQLHQVGLGGTWRNIY